jgi:hypothetical protein
MSVQINNILYYCYNYKTATLIAAKNPPSNWDLVIPNTISFSAINHDITNIAANAFNSCRQINSVIIGDNVTNIGEAAFSFCQNLTNIVIGKNVTHIGNLAFYGCSNLKKVVFTNFSGLIHLGNFIFGNINQNCIIEICGIENEAKLNVSETKIYNMLKNEKHIGIKFIGDDNDKNKVNQIEEPIVTIEDPIIKIEEPIIKIEEPIIKIEEPIKVINNSFIKNNVIYSIKGNHICVIGNYEPPSEWHLIIPKDITISGIKYTTTSIETDAFKNLWQLKNICLPNTITYIGKSAFQGCIHLKETDHHLVIPDGVIEIASDAFNGCKNIKSILLSVKLKTLGDRCFYNIEVNNIVFTSPCSIKNVGNNIFSSNVSKNKYMNVTYCGVKNINSMTKVMRSLHSHYFSNANVIY